VRVPDKHWREWAMAAKLAGVDRNRFIIAVCNNAAFQILKEQKDKEDDARAE
jgi:hypothetical protein